MSESETMWKSPNAFGWMVNDVARELKVSARHVFKLTSENKIPFAKVGRLLRFSPAQIAEWLQKGGTK